MKYLTCLLLFFILIKASAQTEQDLYGAWKFENIVKVPAGKENSIQGISSMFKDMAFTFYDNKRYRASILNFVEEGTWVVKGKTIEMNNGANKLTLLEIVSVEPDKYLTVSYNNVTIALAKAPMSLSDDVSQKIISKWLFAGTRQSAESTLAPSPPGNYIEFTADKKYTSKLGPYTKTGTWTYKELQTGDGVITVTVNGHEAYFKIAGVDATTLSIYMNDTTTQFVFTRAN
jgi:hypothetical protein